MANILILEIKINVAKLPALAVLVHIKLNSYPNIIVFLLIADTVTCSNDVKYPVRLTLISHQLVPIITPYESVFHLVIKIK